MITQVSFGAMVIGDRTHRSDVMIYPDGHVEGGWRRAAGHQLETADIRGLLDSGPNILVVGTGIYGRMRTRSDLESYVREKGIELVAKRTKQAAQEFNRLKLEDQNVAACFHLTC